MRIVGNLELAVGGTGEQVRDQPLLCVRQHFYDAPMGPKEPESVRRRV